MRRRDAAASNEQMKRVRHLAIDARELSPKGPLSRREAAALIEGYEARLGGRSSRRSAKPSGFRGCRGGGKVAQA